MTNRSLLPLLAALALAGCNDQGGDASRQVGTAPSLPEPRSYLVPPMKIASPKPWAADQVPVAAAGLKVAAFARDLVNPRFVYPLPNGDVLVAQSAGPKAPINRPKDLVMGFFKGFASTERVTPNNILLLRDTNGDGVADERHVFIAHLNSPFGIVLVGQDLYIAATDAILQYRYEPGMTSAGAPERTLTPLPAGPINHHWTKDITASADGALLYVSIGSNSNVAENGLEAEADRARIWEVDRQTGRHRVYATGLRNPNGLTINPATKALWTVVNERDEIGPDLVPDYLTSVKDGAFYGWPYSYYGPNLDPRMQPQRPDLVAKAIPPDFALGSHVAPLGLRFAPAEGWPAAYREGAFVGQRGSWNRTPLNGYKVVFVPFAAGMPSGQPIDVVTGFVSPDESTAFGRPVGLGVDRMGALLVADDLGNVVWRVTPAAAAAALR